MKEMKSTFSLYFIIGLSFPLFIFIPILSAEPSFFYQLLSCYLIYIFFLIILVLILQLFSKKRLSIISNFLIEQCDPEAYIQKVLKVMRKKRIGTKIMLASGYLYLGCFETAISEIKTIMPLSKKYRRLYEYACHHLLFKCFLLKDDLAAAQEELNAMQSLLSTKSPTATLLQSSNLMAYVTSRYLLNIAQGNIDGAVSFLNVLLSIPSDLLNKVVLTYRLALCHIQQKNFAATREAANFVIANGNKTIYVALAQELLEEIENKN